MREKKSNHNEVLELFFHLSFGMMIFETVQRKLPWNPLNEAQIPIALAQNQRPSISIGKQVQKMFSKIS